MALIATEEVLDESPRQRNLRAVGVTAEVGESLVGLVSELDLLKDTLGYDDPKIIAVRKQVEELWREKEELHSYAEQAIIVSLHPLTLPMYSFACCRLVPLPCCCA
jgi:hypothetical protein